MRNFTETCCIVLISVLHHAAAFYPNLNLRHLPKHHHTKVYGIDFSNIQDDECEFITDSTSGLELNCITTPSVDITPENVVSLCMDSLQTNDEPIVNTGLQVCFNFSSDSCRAANGGSLEAFMAYASNPTFQSLLNNKDWKVLSVGPEIPGTNTRGAMKTVLISVQPADDKIFEKRFLWTLIKERRPPRQGFWLVHECISVDNAYALTL